MGWGKRRAVVIANAAYSGEAAPFFYELSDQGPDDAMSMAEAFTECEFDTQCLTNASDVEMDEALGHLAEVTQEGDVAVIFFGGHGIEHNGDRLLMGIRANRPGPSPKAGTAVGELVAGFAPGCLLLLLLDCCRNTYVYKLGDTLRHQCQDAFFRDLPIPVAADPPRSHCVISWSTQPGFTVDDGEPGMHSPYVSGLLDAMEEEGAGLAAVLSQVGEDVQLRTRDSQRPEVEDQNNVLPQLGNALPRFAF